MSNALPHDLPFESYYAPPERQPRPYEPVDWRTPIGALLGPYEAREDAPLDVAALGEAVARALAFDVLPRRRAQTIAEATLTLRPNMLIERFAAGEPDAIETVNRYFAELARLAPESDPHD